jgi:hypothetical protein
MALSSKPEADTQSAPLVDVVEATPPAAPAASVVSSNAAPLALTAEIPEVVTAKSAPNPEGGSPVVGVATLENAPNVTVQNAAAHRQPVAVRSALSIEDANGLIGRGDRMFATGDVVSARLFYEYAADAGDGAAALRLGETFDPEFLSRIRMNGVAGDRDKALYWYRRARDLGQSDAEILLKNAGLAGN